MPSCLIFQSEREFKINSSFKKKSKLFTSAWRRRRPLALVKTKVQLLPLIGRSSLRNLGCLLTFSLDGLSKNVKRKQLFESQSPLPKRKIDFKDDKTKVLFLFFPLINKITYKSPTCKTQLIPHLLARVSATLYKSFNGFCWCYFSYKNSAVLVFIEGFDCFSITANRLPHPPSISALSRSLCIWYHLLV